MAVSDAVMLPPDTPGHELYRLNLHATGAFVVAAVLAALVPGALRIPFAVFSCVLFAIGTISFLWAYAKAIERSRNQDVSVGMIYGMSGTTPRPIRRRFHLLTLVQTVAAIATASIHPFTAQAFGILAPMLGLGLAGLWSAQHGEFAERHDGRNFARRQARESSSNG